MKKVFLGLVILLIFTLTGCTDAKQLEERIDSELKNECNNFEAITAGTSRPDELSDLKYVKIGSCNESLMLAESWSINDEIKYESQKFNFNNNVDLDYIFNNTLYYETSNNTSFYITVVTSKDNLENLANNLKDIFLPIVSTTLSKYNSISVHIYTTDEVDVNQEKYKVFLIMKTNGAITSYDKEYNQINYDNIAKTFPGIYASSSSGDIKQQVEEDIGNILIELVDDTTMD